MLAIPLHGDEVAPRFCSSSEFMIAQLRERTVHRVSRMLIADDAWPRRLERLAAAGVTTLLCGGFNRSYLPMAEELGIRVITGLTGQAEEIVEAFLRDDLERHTFVPCRFNHRTRKTKWRKKS